MLAVIVLVSALLILALDQIAKSWVVARLAVDRKVPVGPLALRRVTNAATRGARPTLWMALLALECVWLLGLVQLSPAFHTAHAAAALGAALGGAAGNVADRIWRGGVVDYIDLGFWPVFNLADVAIVAGVGLALMTL
jgi:signal peptidase II